MQMERQREPAVFRSHDVPLDVFEPIEQRARAVTASPTVMPFSGTVPRGCRVVDHAIINLDRLNGLRSIQPKADENGGCDRKNDGPN